MINKKLITNKTNINKVLHFDSIDSSNTYLKKYGKDYPNENKVLVVANTQTEGRGRLKKSFYSPHSGLYFSLLYRYSLTIEDMQLITIVAAVSISEILSELYCLNVSIKWLNDILIHGKKLSGILCEGVLSQSNRYEFIVLGIGINLSTPETIPNEISDIFIALDEWVDTFDKTDFLINFINRFEFYMNDLKLHEKHIIKHYKNKCITLNQDVRVTHHKKTLFAFDISSKGHLIAKDNEGNIHILNSGEIIFEYEN